MSKTNNFLTSHFVKIEAIALSVSLSLLIATPASAHHPFGEITPSNLFEGFMSGLAHPIIGYDHFVFVVAIGLLAALKPQQGIFTPITFILATLAGTGIHLLSLDLPAVEVIISASVLASGVMLARKNNPNLIWLIGLAAIAGVFHGYAYGEAIVGAEMTPLVAYLSGFAIIQLVVSLLAFLTGKFILNQVGEKPSLPLRFAGFTICGIGSAFLSSLLLG